MEIRIDFSEVDAPTAKQIDLVQDIIRALSVPKPREFTFDDYSDFITCYIDEYYGVSNG